MQARLLHACKGLVSVSLKLPNKFRIVSRVVHLDMNAVRLESESLKFEFL